MLYICPSLVYSYFINSNNQPRSIQSIKKKTALKVLAEVRKRNQLWIDTAEEFFPGQTPISPVLRQVTNSKDFTISWKTGPEKWARYYEPTEVKGVGTHVLDDLTLYLFDT